MNKNAVTGAVLATMGIIGMLFSPLFFSFTVVALVLGIIAIAQITKRNERGLLLAIWACLSLFVLLAVALAVQGNNQG